MAETLTGSYHESSDKLRNDKNKGPENPDDIDIRRRYMKMQAEIERIVNNGTISDLGGDKASEVKNITYFMEGNIALVLDILKISDKEKIIEASTSELNLLIKDTQEKVDLATLGRKENVS